MKRLIPIFHLIILFFFAIFFVNFYYKQPYCWGKTQYHIEQYEQKRCPVMGYPINRNVYVDYKGKRIYFCCPACKEKFLENPGKYMKKLKEEGIILKEVPKTE